MVVLDRRAMSSLEEKRVWASFIIIIIIIIITGHASL